MLTSTSDCITPNYTSEDCLASQCKMCNNICRIITFPLFTHFFQYQYPKEIIMKGNMDFMGVTDKQRVFWSILRHIYVILTLFGTTK